MGHYYFIRRSNKLVEPTSHTSETARINLAKVSFCTSTKISISTSKFNSSLILYTLMAIWKLISRISPQTCIRLGTYYVHTLLTANNFSRCMQNCYTIHSVFYDRKSGRWSHHTHRAELGFRCSSLFMLCTFSFHFRCEWAEKKKTILQLWACYGFLTTPPSDVETKTEKKRKETKNWIFSHVSPRMNEQFNLQLAILYSNHFNLYIW